MPEDSSGADDKSFKADTGYRADLTIYFKGITAGTPVEVKWCASAFQKSNQVNYLAAHHGFLVAFGAPTTMLKNVEYVQIDSNDFSDWVARNISKLVRQLLVYQAKVSAGTAGKQFWLVFLRGTAHDNFSKMLNECRGSKTAFWAYKNDRSALSNIFDVQKGDECVFILAKTPGFETALAYDPQNTWQFKAYYVTRIVEPYYISLDQPKGTFFEASHNLPVGERRWPHFTDFEIVSDFESDQFVDAGKRGEFADAFALSSNYGAGAPVPIPQRQWDALLDCLRTVSAPHASKGKAMRQAAGLG